MADDADDNSADRARAYRPLLRWYPRAWLARNADAVIGTLMDQDDAAGRTAPPRSTAASLLLGALHERFIARERASAFALTALGGGVAYSAWYVVAISWSPGSAWPGTVGPFSNPSVFVAITLVLALTAAAAGRARTARLLALASAPVALAVGGLSAASGWLGPSWAAVAIFAAFGLLSATRVRRFRDVARIVLAWALTVVGAGAFDFAILNGSPFANVDVAIAAGIAVLALAMAAVLAWPTRRRQLGTASAARAPETA